MLSQEIKYIHLIKYTLGDEVRYILVDACFPNKILLNLIDVYLIEFNFVRRNEGK